MDFVHETPPTRVLFGAGRIADLATEVAALGERPLLIAGRTASGIVGPALDEIWAEARIDRVRQHVPIENAESARALARRLDVDCIVAIGGGSAIGLAKAVALTERLGILAVPTTYSGSEMTPVWGLTENGVKVTGLEPAVIPRVVIYDPRLTYALPAALTAASGLNAVAHCVDALWAPKRSPMTELTGMRGIAVLAEGLPGAVKAGDNAIARERSLLGAWLAGITFAAAGPSFHHKLCHVLGARFDLPHAELHAVILPWTTDLAIRSVPAAGATLASALGVEDPVAGLRDLARRLGTPTRLSELGLSRVEACRVAAAVDPDRLGASFAISQDDVNTILLGATCGGAG